MRVSAAITNETVPGSRLLLAGGSLMPVLNKFAVTSDEVTVIWRRLLHAIHPGDLFALLLVAFFAVPLGASLLGATPESGSYTYLLMSHLSQAARLGIIVYIFDCFVVIFHSVGFPLSDLTKISKGLTKILYICWIAQRVSVLKRYLLGKAISKNPEKLGRMTTVDQMLDGMIFVITGIFLLDTLDVDMGVGVTSVFAFGSAGTLVIGLASQDLATMFVNGLILHASDRINEGDHIVFGNGNNGQIIKIGWFQTTLKHYDELVEVIPNSELGNQRVTNKSRVQKCRVVQTLRLRYEDVEKFDELLPAILDEIKASCPEVIADGSAPFRAYWTDYKEDFLAVTVDTHYNLPPMGDLYLRNKQKCLQAIHRAVKNCKAQFVTTLYPQGINN